MFQFKWPSLLQFDEHCNNDLTFSGNLRRLYSLDKVASDSQMRAIFGDRYLLSIDGTGLHSSNMMQYPQCGVKKQRNGQIKYCHQTLSAVIVHPDQKTV